MDRNKKGTTAIDQTTDQDVYSPIKESAKVNWPTMLMIFVGMWVSMYSVNVGMAVGQSYSAKPAIIATVLGYAIAGIFAALISDAGQRTGLASYVLAKCPLGSVGQIMIALLMFVTIGLGSVGLQADTVARSISATFPSIPYSPIMSGIVCAVMMVSAVIGMKAMGAVSWVTMPLFFIVSIVATVMAVNNFGGMGAVMAIENTGYTFSEVVFLNAGAWAGFVMLMPDVSRFLKKRKYVYTVIPIAFLIGSIPPVCGVILGAALGQSMDTVFVSLGLGGIGNLSFITWISGFHGSFNMSFVGVLIAHFFVVSKENDKFVQTKGLAGILAWLISGLLTYFGVLPIPVITNTLLAFCLYLILYYGVEKRIWGETVVEKIVPPRIIR